MRLLLGVVLLGGAAAAQAQTVIWESPLTVGTSGGNVGYSTGTSSFGSLTTPTFSYKGRSATVTLLVTNAGGDSLVLTGSGITGSGRLTNWTLHIDDDTFAGADASTAASSYFWQTIPTWSSGLVVTVKLTTTEPGAPTGVTAMRTDATTVSLGWTAPTSIGGSAITKYQYRQKSGTGSYGSWTDILNSASLTSYDVTVQAASAAHTFQLRAVNTAGAGLWSDPAEAINPVPAAPIHVSVTAHATTTPGSIQLRWEFPFGSPSHTSIEFRASTDSGVNWNHAVTDDWPDTTEDSNDKTFLAGLTPGTAYTFEVRGRNAFGPGPAAQVTGTTAAAVSITGVALTSNPAMGTTYATGEDVVATLTFSRPVTFAEVGGNLPQLELDFGGTGKPAACAATTQQTAVVCTGNRFSVNRTGLASLLFAIFRSGDARGASVNAERVKLTFGSRSAEIALRDIEAVEVKAGRRWAGVRLVHAGMAATVSGLPPTESRALADAVERARVDWWRRALAPQIGALRSVHDRLAGFADPQRYVHANAFGELMQDAQAAAGGLVGHWPDALCDAPEIRMLKDILEFLEAPDDARSKANKAFVANELVRSRDLFDRIEARPLTDEQRTAVVVDERRNLVVAAAGSGKTSVIVAKAGWLVRRGYRKPPELLLLAFARDARNEMEERVRKRLGEAARGVTVRTFHSLGMAIIGDAEGKRPALSRTAENDRALFDVLKGIVADLSADGALSETVLEWFQDQFAPYRSEHEFPTWGAYWNYIRRNDIRSLKGDEVKSFEECEIANFLYLNGVSYEYEAPYEHETATAEKRQYKPDFHLPDHGIYIEHFGLDAAGNTAPFVDREKYLQEIEWKRRIHAERGTVLVETFSHERADGRLIRNLTEKLGAHGVTLMPVPRDRVFAALEERGRIDPFTRVLATFLQHFKGSRLSLDAVAKRARGLEDRARAEAFLAVFGPVFERYRETLADAGEIDFHDMINRATDHVEAGRYRSPFGYILVDEFQDISPGRARLLQALLDRSPGAQLFAVGDDWQAIYRFGGSDIAVMREFGDRFGDFERVDLETTFRCSERIAAVATDFVLRNPAQIRKTVRATRKSDGPAVHVGLPGDDGLSLLKEALDRIAEDAGRHDGTSEVLLLGRYRHLQPLNLGSLAKQYPGLRFTYMTVHRAKGLEADYAVVLGLCAGKFGFPVEIADDPLLDLVMAAPEGHPNAEERRLLYVALTRARRQVFLLAEGGSPSTFVTELIDGGYDVSVFGRPPEGDVACPQCKEGRLERRENARDGNVFYGCSNWPWCEHTGRPCPKCGTGLLVGSGGAFLCRDCGGSIEGCPVCDGWLETRMGKFGRFLGCSNYPDCAHTRNLQKPRAGSRRQSNVRKNGQRERN